MTETIPNKPLPTVSVVILNWNGKEFLARCLEAVYSQNYQDFEVILIDNASKDGSIEEVEIRWPEVRVIRLERNIGFAAANNLGARLAEGRWLALLNNDAFPDPEWLGTLIGATQRYPEYTFLGSRLLQDRDRNVLDGTGDVYHISGLAWRRNYNQPVGEAGNDTEEIFSPCAAAALYSLEIFRQVGGFEEDFFSYHEDVDLSFRLHLQGHRCLYVPQAVVAHVGSASTGKRSDFAVYHGHRNLVWSYFQNMPATLFWKYLPAHLIANLIFLIYYSIRGQGKAIWRAKMDALSGIPNALRKRRQIQANLKVGTAEISRLLEHGWLKPYLFRFRAR